MSPESAECKAANCQTQARNKSWIFAFSQFCQSLNILGDSVQIDQIYHLRRQFSLTLTLSNTYRCKCILIPQNDFGMQTNLVNRQGHSHRVHFIVILRDLGHLLGPRLLSRHPEGLGVFQFQQNLVQQQWTFFRPSMSFFPLLIPYFPPSQVHFLPHPFVQFQLELVDDWLHLVLGAIVHDRFGHAHNS